MPSTDEPTIDVRRAPGGVSFGMVDTAVIRDRSLPANVKTLYTYLATYCGDTRSAYPSRATIAKDTGLSVRSIDAAITTAETAGLITVERRREGKVNKSSIYWLRDLGRGYVPGSGPLSSEGGGAGAAPGVGQQVHQGGAGAAPEQDKRSRPTSIKTNNAAGEDDSVDDACQRVPTSKLAGEPTKPLRIFRPRGFYDWDDGHAMQHTVSAAVAALRAAGCRPSRRCPDAIGEMFRRNIENGCTRRVIVDHIEREINLAAGGDPEYQWMITPHGDPFASAS